MEDHAKVDLEPGALRGQETDPRGVAVGIEVEAPFSDRE
jgi:hypothetical protein